MALSASRAEGFTRTAKWAATRLLDAFLPPQCLACAAPVERPGRLCATCWSGLRFIGAPQCARCGVAFELELPAGTLCGLCLQNPPTYDRARAAFGYDGVGRSLVLGFKMADRTYCVPAFTAWLERAGAPLIEDADLLVPVPLHRWRLFARRFNQSALLTRDLARRTGKPWSPAILWRRRATPSQASLPAAERRRNVRGAFAVPPRARDLIRGRRLLLIDDVLTTGSTANACAETLLKAGAGAVDVLTLARRDRHFD
ncbi:MAG: ComF family protein [Alphaproteobacteria bacterium]|nr:ComF family protein [Alphaproteobacteria bacterium]